ncbi:MAG: type IV secretion system protein [Aeromonas sp.]
MKKHFLSLAVASAMVLSSPTFAAGIPVVDVAAIAKTVEEGLTRAQEAKAQLDQAMADYNQAKGIGEAAQKRFEGYSDFSNVFDTAASFMKENVSDLAKPDDIGALRDEYGVVSKDPAVQEKYDGMLKEISLYDNFNKSLIKTSKQLDDLQGDFAAATTPQQKEDISNQLQMEMLKQQAVMQQFTIAQAKIAQDQKIQKQKIADAFMDAHTYKGS